MKRFTTVLLGLGFLLGASALAQQDIPKQERKDTEKLAKAKGGDKDKKKLETAKGGDDKGGKIDNGKGKGGKKGAADKGKGKVEQKEK